MRSRKTTTRWFLEILVLLFASVTFSRVSLASTYPLWFYVYVPMFLDISCEWPNFLVPWEQCVHYLTMTLLVFRKVLCDRWGVFLCLFHVFFFFFNIHRFHSSARNFLQVLLRTHELDPVWSLFHWPSIGFKRLLWDQLVMYLLENIETGAVLVNPVH